MWVVVYSTAKLVLQVLEFGSCAFSQILMEIFEEILLVLNMRA